MWGIVAELPKFSRISCHHVDCYTNDEYLVSDCFTTKHISGNVYACSTLKLILHIDGSQIQY